MRYLLLSLCLCLMPISWAAQQSLDRIVAIVNDAVITQSEFNHAVSIVNRQFAGTAAPSQEVLRKQVLDQLINRALQLQIAEQMGMKITDEAVNKAITSIAKQNHLSLAQLYLKVQEQGLSKKDYRSEIHDEMLFQQLQQQEIGSKIMIHPQEVDDFLRSQAWQSNSAKEFHLEDVLVALPDAPTSEQIAIARNKANELIAKLKQGSQVQTATKKADLGWRQLTEIPTAFASELVHLQGNDFLGPIQTSNGFHIVHVAGMRDVKGASAHNKIPSKREVQQLIYQRKFDENVKVWLAKLRGEAFIKIDI